MKTNSEESALNSAVTTKNHYGDTGVLSITHYIENTALVIELSKSSDG